MNRILFGDNQFFGVNHISDEKSRLQALHFKNNSAILTVIDHARENDINTFMCTTHDRISSIADIIRQNPFTYQDFIMYPCMPYAHKYANAITEFGMLGAIQQYMPGNFLTTIFKGGKAFIIKDYISLMKIFIDTEMKMFNGIDTPVIFLQNIVTDLLLGLNMIEVLKEFNDYIKMKYNAEAGFISMNMPLLLEKLESAGVFNPIICTSINKIGFRMSGGKDLYEHTLKNKNVRVIAMQVLAGGTIAIPEAIEYVCKLPNIESILFGASTQKNISHTVSLIKYYDKMYSTQPELIF